MTEQKIKPLFKYIGGKSWLRDYLRQEVLECLKNKKISGYVEPFAGGLGSFLSVYDILLSHGIKNVILSDINPTLMATYDLIKNNPDQLVHEYLVLEQGFVDSLDASWKNTKNKEEVKLLLKNGELFFNQVKKDFNSYKLDNSIHNNNNSHHMVTQSARLVFLQKHAFNGVYRENSKGGYNTPFNWSGSDMLASIEKKVYEMHQLFNSFHLTFMTQSFENLDYNQETLYYLDPPYMNEEIGENKYSKDSFSLAKQLMLIDKIRHSPFIYSNHKSVDLINAIAQIENVEIKEIARKNIMSASAASRQDDKLEILVRHTPL